MTTIHEATKNLPRVVASERVLTVYVHPGATMVVPRSEWLSQLRYTDEPERNVAPDRMLAASMGEDILYLALKCSKEEAWHRLMQIRKAIRAYDRNEQGGE